MIFYYDHSVVLGLCGTILLVIVWIYRSVTKPYESLPTFPVVSHWIRCKISGKFPRNSLSTEYSILSLKAMKKKYSKESLRTFMKNSSRIPEIIAYRMSSPWLQPKLIFNLTSSGREYMKLCNEWNNFIRNVISDIKESASTSQPVKTESSDHAENRKSFVHILLDHSLKNPSFTSKNLEDQVKTFMVAGFDTIATSMMWVLYLLGLHQDIQEQVYNEVTSVTDNFVTFEQLCELKYMERVIMETLRLYPTIPIAGRELKKDVEFGKYKVPKGTDIAFFWYALHRNTETYPDPGKFDPNRFEENLAKRPYAIAPFSSGIRDCIGKRFAMMEMKVIVAHIIRNFKITSLNKREDIRLHWQISLMPTEPIFLQLTPRQHDH